MKKILSILMPLFTIVTMYLPNGDTKVWKNVQSYGFEDARSLLMVKGYAMIPVLWFITEEGQKIYLHGDYTVELEMAKPPVISPEPKEES